MQGTRDQGVVAGDAQCLRTLEAVAGCLRADARDSRQPAVERPVQNVEPPAAERLERQPVGDPGGESQNGLDPRLRRGLDRNRTAHGEADQERALRRCLPDCRPRVRDAPVQALPGLDPVAHLGEPQLGEGRRQPVDEPLERGAPGPLHLRALAAVHATTAAPPVGPVTRSSAPVESRCTELV